jgi:hypothetical protein
MESEENLKVSHINTFRKIFDKLLVLSYLYIYFQKRMVHTSYYFKILKLNNLFKKKT